MFDLNLMLIDSVADVVADTTGEAIDFKGGDLTEQYYAIQVPAVSSGESLVVKIQHSATTTDGDFTDLVTSPSIIAAGEYIVHARSSKRYRRAILDVTDNGGTVNLGKIRVGVVAGGTYTNW